MIRVSVFNEFFHERKNEAIKAIYPEGIHATIAAFLGAEEDMTVRTFTQNEEGDCPELTEDALNDTDVLLLWGGTFAEADAAFCVETDAFSISRGARSIPHLP